MTDRLYYQNSFLYDFVAALEGERTLPDGRRALVLDRTAFYPTSGGQVFDTGWIELEPLEGNGSRPKLRVAEVIDDEQSGQVLHVVEPIGSDAQPAADGPVRVRGFIDVDRRRDHMQQHSGQHILSAAFIELFEMKTVSFHMGEETCTIDLETKGITPEQVRHAEQRANEVILEDRPVAVHYVTEDEARAMGVRKIPAAGHEKLRLVDIKDFDLCGCGGTHVQATGQVGSILIRKTEKVKQGMRVEFVCGLRAVRHARRDYETLTEAASLFSSHIWEVPAAIRKTQDDAKAAAKAQQRSNEQIAEFVAREMLASAAEEKGEKLIAQVLADRDLAFTRLLTQKLTALSPNCVALLGAASGQPALVFAQSPGLKHDMGALMKQAMSALGARGGGSKDLAQGGAPDASKLEPTIQAALQQVRAEQ